MQLSTTKTYKYNEIKTILHTCPICQTSDQLDIKSSIEHSFTMKGKEGINCNRCHLQLSFTFEMDQNNEIIDAYQLDFCKVGALEFINSDAKLILYSNNTYVKDIDTNIVDLDKCKALVILS